jgi:hypothetical protein
MGFCEAASSGLGAGGLVVEAMARIRREFFVTGRSIKEIARDRKVSRSAIQKVLLPGATLECMRCENQYPLGETGLARYLSERGCDELGLKREAAEAPSRPLISD